MKALSISFLLVSGAVMSHAQVALLFENVDLYVPVYESDGVTRLKGSQFMAELLVGPSVDNLVSLSQTGFLTGLGVGFFNGGSVPLPPNIHAGDFAYVQVRAWNTLMGASFVEAQASGVPNAFGSAPILHLKMTGIVDQRVTFTRLEGLQSFNLNSVPGPSDAVHLPRFRWPSRAFVVSGGFAVFESGKRDLHRRKLRNISLQHSSACVRTSTVL